MGSPRVSTVGTKGTQVVFVVNGRSFTVVPGAINPASAGTLTEAQANALIASGQATPDSNSYLAQFPWTTPATK